MPTSANRPAVILLSGGLDSTTCLAMAMEMGFTPYVMTFRYGQRQQFEIQAAQKIADHYKVAKHVIVNIYLREFGGSALTSEIEVPKDRPFSEIVGGIPITYVPARNTIFLSFALAWAEVLKSDDIFIGVNSLDYSGFPDCRPEYIAAYQAMADLATREGVEGRQHLTIHTPLLHLTKAQTIAKGIALGVDYQWTSTCYDPDINGAGCGRCDACQLRLEGFAENGLKDPAPYQPRCRGPAPGRRP